MAEPEEKPEETELEKLEKLNKLRENYEEKECTGISVNWDEEKQIFTIKLYNDKTKKTSCLIFNRKELTPELRIGLRAIANMTENILWVSGGSNDGPPMFV